MRSNPGGRFSFLVQTGAGSKRPESVRKKREWARGQAGQEQGKAGSRLTSSKAADNAAQDRLKRRWKLLGPITRASKPEERGPA
ncbi:hypothetical protein [Paenibacillus peoriae]|uniref:hypothetical protein n=1 Tax=Paenibacillus peoriae TaxID=59893 RepID=UPI0019F953F4|nr:hypothetical protein [Paenibacillus peoriae]KAF6628137.1 hypothetical protein H6F38_20180 [Paenibacillus sp. EKM208P]